jgi:hypothetical protein
VRITSAEWRGEDRWTAGFLAALLVQGAAIVALSIAVARRGTPFQPQSRVASREQSERLRFVAPVTPPPALPPEAAGPARARRRPTAGALRAPVAPSRADSTAQPVAAPAASPSGIAPLTGLLASPLPVDSRLFVTPNAAGDGAATRLRGANASIASRLRAVQDSVRRYQRGWTLGDSTHRFGIAPCGIEVGIVCIPFGVGSLPNPATQANGIDLTRASNEAEIRAAIARIRSRDSVPNDGSGRAAP